MIIQVQIIYLLYISKPCSWKISNPILACFNILILFSLISHIPIISLEEVLYLLNLPYSLILTPLSCFVILSMWPIHLRVLHLTQHCKNAWLHPYLINQIIFNIFTIHSFYSQVFHGISFFKETGHILQHSTLKNTIHKDQTNTLHTSLSHSNTCSYSTHALFTKAFDFYN